MSLSRWTLAITFLAGGAVGVVGALLLAGGDPGYVPTILVTAAVAVVVAGITAVTTDKRQQQQLAHDRELHDLDGLRALLDELSAMMFAATQTMARMARIVSGQQGTIEGELFEELTDPLNRAQAIWRDFTPLAGQVLVHVDAEHPLYIEWAKFMGLLSDSITTFLEDPTAEELERRLSELIELGGPQARVWREAARQAVAYRVAGVSQVSG